MNDVDRRGANAARIVFAGVNGVVFDTTVTTENVHYVALEDLP